MEINTDYKVSNPTPKSWSSVYGNRPDNNGELKKYGELFAVISLRSEIDFDLARVGGLLLDNLQNTYFDPEVSEVNINHFEYSLNTLRKFIDEILVREPELAQYGLDMEMSVVGLRGEIMYAAVVGESKVFIQREGQLVDISESLIDPESDGFLRSGSLFVQEQDRLLMLTSQVAANYSTKTIKSALDSLSMREFGDLDGAVLGIGIGVKAKPQPALIQQEIVEEVPAELTSEEKEEVLEEIEDEIVEKIEEGIEEQGGPMAILAEENKETELPQATMQEGDEQNTRTPNSKLQTQDGEEDEEWDEEYEDEEMVSTAAGQNPKLDKLKMHLGAAAAKTKVHAATAATFLGGLAAAAKAKLSKAQNPFSMQQEEYEEDEEEVLMPQDSGDSEEDYAPVASSSRMTGLTSNLRTGVSAARQIPLRRIASQTGTNLRRGFIFVDNLVTKLSGKSNNIRGVKQNNTRFWMAVAAVCLVLILFGGYSLVNNARRQNAIADLKRELGTYTTRWESLKVNVDAAVINNAAISDKQSLSRDLLKLISDLEKVKKSEYASLDIQSTADTTLAEVSEKQDYLFGVQSFTQPAIISDFAAYFPNTNLRAVAVSAGQLYVLDKARGVVYRVAPTLQAEPGEFISGLTSPYLMSLDQNKDLVVIDDNADSVVATVEINTKNVRRHPGLSKTRIGTLAAMYVWAFNKAMYSVAPAKQSLVKQDLISTNFQLPNDASPWRLDGDLVNATDLYVDGSVYALIKGKGLIRYFGGQPATVELAGLTAEDTSALNQANTFHFTNDSLFMADPLGRRIFKFKLRTDSNVVFDYVNQYKFKGEGDTFKNITDITLDDQGKLYILDGTKLLRLDV